MAFAYLGQHFEIGLIVLVNPARSRCRQVTHLGQEHSRICFIESLASTPHELLVRNAIDVEKCEDVAMRGLRSAIARLCQRQWITIDADAVYNEGQVIGVVWRLGLHVRHHQFVRLRCLCSQSRN